MIEFKVSKNTALMLYGVILVITAMLAGVLIKQYQYFKQETQELEQVKESYYQHVEMLKRSLNASIADDSEEPDSEDDKKKNDLTPYLEVVTQEEIKSEDEFELISSEEEQQLRLIKQRLRVFNKPKNTSRKKIIKQVLPKVVKKSMRYGPHRDFAFDWPIDLSKFWLSSLYGPRKLSNGKISFHHAVDMAALKGTPVKAAASGKVILAQFISGYGNCVLIEHSSRYRTRYAHLDSIGVQVGQIVAVGQCIGTVGDTGYVRKSGKDASHLHFEIYHDGERVNPLKYLF